MTNLSNDGIQWFCGTLTPIGGTGSGARRRLLQAEAQPTATVTMYTLGAGVVNNRSAATDFYRNITDNGVNGVFVTQLARAYIVVNSTTVVPGGVGAASDDGGGGGLSTGALVGIIVGSVLGALLLLCCLIGLCFLIGICGRRDRDISEPSSAEASRKREERPIGGPIAGSAFGPAATGLAGAATTAPDLSGEESVYRSYHTPPPAEVSEVDPDQSSQLHIHV